jgi:hypothetical protein
VSTPDSPEARPGPGAPAPGKDASAEELVADIEATRAELGNTVDALSEKFDVKTQAQRSLEDAKQRAGEQARVAQARGTELFNQAMDAATDDDGNLTPQVRALAVKVAAGGAAVLVLGAVWKKVRR